MEEAEESVDGEQEDREDGRRVEYRDPLVSGLPSLQSSLPGRGLAGLAIQITSKETPGAFATGDREQLPEPSYGETFFLYLVFFVMFLVHCNAM